MRHSFCLNYVFKNINFIIYFVNLLKLVKHLFEINLLKIVIFILSKYFETFSLQINENSDLKFWLRLNY